jgi:hypothetical protein
VHGAWLIWVAEVMDDAKIAPTTAHMSSFEGILKYPGFKEPKEVDDRMKTEALLLPMDL